MTPERPLSAGAEELLHGMAQHVAGGVDALAPRLDWLAALMELRPDLLEAGGLTADAARSLAANATADARGLTTADLTARAATRAESSGHAVVTPADLAAVLVEVTRDLPRRPVEHTPEDAAPAVPLSATAERLVAVLSDRAEVVAGGDRTPGAHEWVSAIVAVDPALVEQLEGKPATEVGATARERIDAGDPGESLTRDELIARVGLLAAAASRPVATGEDVATAVLAVTMRAPDHNAGKATSGDEQPDETGVATRADAPSDRPTRTFRVFVSSTFDDLRAERDVLQRRVFPELRELCRDRSARFQAIDLRWGVSEEAARDQQTMSVCLAEIERCRAVTPRPNFIVLLGQHYGWRPLPEQLDETEFCDLLDRVADAGDRDLLERWYERDENAVPTQYRLRPRIGAQAPADHPLRDQHESAADWDSAERKRWEEVESRLRSILDGAVQGLDRSNDDLRRYTASATEQEIAAGALADEDAGEKVVCFLRTIGGSPAADAPVGRFIDADQGPVDSLRRSLEQCLPVERVIAIPSAWVGETLETDLDELCDRALDILGRSIARELEQPSRPVATEDLGAPELVDPELDDEGREHREFGWQRARVFVGRDDALLAIADHLAAPGGRAFVVVGDGGSGKSALLARAVHDAATSNSAAELVVRYIGSTATSSDVRRLLEGLCRELARRYGAPASSVLGAATADRPLVVVLDGLDQLSPGDNAHALFWLPSPLPEHVHLVLSTRPGEMTDAVERLTIADRRLVLGPMSRDEGDTLLELWLGAAHRTLQAQQRQAVLDAFDATHGNPLYLRLAFHQARRWPSELAAPALPCPRERVGSSGSSTR